MINSKMNVNVRNISEYIEKFIKIGNTRQDATKYVRERVKIELLDRQMKLTRDLNAKLTELSSEELVKIRKETNYE